MSRYESATCRCPHCGRTFRVLADEVGMHPCPRCGFDEHDEREEYEDGGEEG